LNAREALQKAVIATVFGVLLLAFAIGLTWLSPDEKVSDAAVVCVRDGGGEVTAIDSVPTVKSGSLTVVPCPEGSGAG
jgi:hypothetical protein